MRSVGKSTDPRNRRGNNYWLSDWLGMGSSEIVVAIARREPGDWPRRAVIVERD